MLVEILTGLALYSRVVGNPVLTQFIGWLPQLIDAQYLREIHYFLMFVFFAFAIFHVYASVLVSIEEENGLLDSIFSGWKFVPAGELRHEVAAIPEARSFVKRHQLLPRGTPDEKRAGRPPAPRPGPGPVALYRNWISFAGTGIAAVGLLVFAVLTAYHTIGGGALVQPYGDLVIFFVPPLFVIAGVAVVLIGMYVQWIRWRMYKPLSFARYPQWDLNVARERKALLVVAIGAAVLSVPAIYGGYQAYRYTDAVPFCGALCHSMTPEYVTYQLSPHARVACAQCHVGPGAAGYLESKIRGVVELEETIQDRLSTAHSGSRDGAAPDTRQLRAVPLAGSFLRSPRGAPGAFPVRRAEHPLGDRHGGAGRRGRVRGAHRKWEFTGTWRARWSMSRPTPRRQNITWVRAVDPRTGQANVYTSQPRPSTTAPAGEIRTVDCVDCHNRPTHILQVAGSKRGRGACRWPSRRRLFRFSSNRE